MQNAWLLFVKLARFELIRLTVWGLWVFFCGGVALGLGLWLCFLFVWVFLLMRLHVCNVRKVDLFKIWTWRAFSSADDYYPLYTKSKNKQGGGPCPRHSEQGLLFHPSCPRS